MGVVVVLVVAAAAVLVVTLTDYVTRWRGYCQHLGLFRSDRVDVMEMLLRAGSDINALNQKQHSPLQLAVAKPSKDCIAALLKHHLCNVNIQVWPAVFVVSCLCM